MSVLIAAGSTAAQIQAAINTAPPGETISLASGSYQFDRTVVINRDDITVTGAGAALTVITTASAMNGAPAFRIGEALFNETLTGPVSMAFAAEGATVITVSTGHTFKPGDAVWIETANDAAFLDAIGDCLWREDKPLRTALAVVISVSGTQITLDRGLPFAFNSAGTVVREINPVTGVVLKDMALQGSYGTADPANFTNTQPLAAGGMTLLINTSDGVVISGINIVQPASNGLVIGKSLDAPVTSVSVTGAHNKADGGNGYGFWIRDCYDGKFEGLSAYDTRHAVLFASYTSSSGNEVYVTGTNRDINFHGGLDHDNIVLVEHSVRTGAEQGYLGSVSFVNPGTDYGAPTEPSANTILFREGVGTVRADVVVGMSGGVKFSTLGGNDTLTGGNGSDRLDAGTGIDLIHATRGSDTVIGGEGTDTVDFDMLRSAVTLSVYKGALVVRGEFGVTRMTGVEYVTFDNGRFKVTDLITQVTQAAAVQTLAVPMTAQTMLVAANADAFVFHDAAFARPEPGLLDAFFGRDAAHLPDHPLAIVDASATGDQPDGHAPWHWHGGHERFDLV